MSKKESQAFLKAAELLRSWSNHLCDEARTPPITIYGGAVIDTTCQSKLYAAGILANISLILRDRAATPEGDAR